MAPLRKSRRSDPVNGRCLLIGLDGATYSMLDPLMQEGVMPFLRRFVDAGVRAELLSVVPPLTPPGWTSIMTGRTPGNHGIVDFFTYESEHSRLVRFVDSSDVGCETIWSIVSRSGLSATALNFPMTSPPRPIAGSIVPGWVNWRYLRKYCFPEGLYERLAKLPGFSARELAMDLELERKALDGYVVGDQEEWLQFHVRRERQWFNVLAYLVDTEPHHLTAVVFDGTDRLQHLFWRLLDPDGLAGQLTEEEKKVRSLCFDYFRQLDQIISDAIGLVGDDVNVFIVSDHGAGPSHEVFYVNTWLQQNGYLTWAAQAPARAEDSGTMGLGQIGWMHRLIDWSNTSAYAATPSSNGIHICVRGQRGDAGIAPEDYDTFRRRLADGLTEYRDPGTGEPVVTEVLTREEAFPGQLMHLAPDLTLKLRDGGFVSTVKSDVLLSSRSEVVGTHRPEGVFMASGPNIAKGRRLSQVSVTDVTPTLLYSLGLPVPDDLDGRVVSDAFRPSYVRDHPIEYGEPTRPVEAFPAREVETEQDEVVVARLKALGYIE